MDGQMDGRKIDGRQYIYIYQSSIYLYLFDFICMRMHIYMYVICIYIRRVTGGVPLPSPAKSSAAVPGEPKWP
jgi:hypothetical protein